MEKQKAPENKNVWAILTLRKDFLVVAIHPRILMN